MQFSFPAIPGLFRSQQGAPSKLKASEKPLIVLFLAPAVLLFLFFIIYAIGQSFYYSLFNWKGFGPAVDFIGLQNYANIFSDRVFLGALRNGLFIITFSLGLQLPLSLFLAVLVGRDLPGRTLFRSIFFIPYVLSEVTAALMWLFLYSPDPNRGFINAVWTAIPGNSALAWLANVDLVMPAIFVALTWKFFGFHMLLYLTGLQNIPNELEEAARIDGTHSKISSSSHSRCWVAPSARRYIYLCWVQFNNSFWSGS